MLRRLALIVCCIGLTPLALAAERSPARQALDRKLQQYPGAEGGTVLEITDAAVAAALPGRTVFVLRFRQYPVGMVPPPPLGSNNLFLVDAQNNVVLVSQAKALQEYVTDALAPVRTDEAARTAARAWLRLVQELHQDGMFQFNPPGNLEVVSTDDMPPSSISVTGSCTVDGRNGDQGKITSTLVFQQGKLAQTKDNADLRAGMRPICQATKLLDPDPIVRRMAEQDILLMGRTCEFYLQEQRRQAGPELQQAIDRIWQRIVEEGR
jgi:hypothetical protein